MAGNIKGITIEIGGDTTKLEKALKSVNTTSRELNKELRDINTSLKFNPGNAELLAQKQRALGDAIENTKKKLDQLKIAQEQASAALKNGDIGQDEYDALRREIIKTENQLKSLEGQANQTAQSLKGISEKFMSAGKTLNSAGDTMTKNVTVPLTALGTLSVKSAADFDSAMVGVRKTTDLTDEEFAKMGQTIRDMAKEIPATTTEIAAVAEAAGQLGISKENLVDFARVMIDLGETTNLTSDQAATSFARFANITQMPQGKMENLGSTVVALGNNFATTEAEIVAMGMRLAGTGTQVGLSEAEIMGLATAMSSVGIEAEGGGTAMSMVLNKINNALASSGAVMKDFEYVAHETGLSVEQLQNYVLGGSEGIKALAKSTGISEDALKALAKDYEKAVIPAEGFAAVVEKGGMAAEDFARKWETAPSEVLEAFVKGLAEVDKEGGNVNLTLKELGIAGVRETDTLNRLTGAADLLPDAFRMANEAFLENTALAAEAELRYKSFQAQFDVFKNKLNDVAITIGTTLLPAVTDIITGIGNFADKIAGADPKMVKLGVSIAAIAAAVGPVLKVLGGLATVIGTVTGALATAMGGAAAATPAVAGLAKVFTVLSGPIGIAIGALVAAGVAFGVLDGHMKQSSIQTDLFGEEVSEATKEAAGSFLNLEKEAGNSLMQLNSSGKNVTEELANSISSKFENMKNDVVSNLEAQKNESLETARAMYEEMGTLSDEAIQERLDNIATSYDAEIIKHEEASQRIKEILEQAAEDKRALTQTERAEIDAIRTQMKDDGIRVLSESEAEYSVIMQRMKDQAGALSAEQAAEVVQNSVKQRDETIAAAEEEYNDRIKLAEQLRLNGSAEAIAMADEIIAEAKRQRDETIKEANEMHDNVLTDAKEFSGEYIEHIDWTTGEILTKWEKFGNDFEQKAKETWEGVKASTTELWESIKTKFNEGVQKLQENWNQIKENSTKSNEELRTKLENIWNNIKTAAQTKWEETKKAMIKPVEDAKTAIGKIIEDIKSFFTNLELKLPEIQLPKLPKLPQVKVSGSFSLNPPSAPSISWYDQGGIFRSPTIIGVGEKRPEFVGALEDLENMIDKSNSKYSKGSSGVSITIEQMVVRNDSDIKRIAEELNKLQQKANRSVGLVGV